MMFMAAKRTRIIATVLGVVTVAVVVGGLSHPALIEQWHLWRLESDNEDVCRAAAEALGKRRSVRAVPKLFGLLMDPEAKSMAMSSPRELRAELLVALQAAARQGQKSSGDREVQRIVEEMRRHLRSTLPNSFALDALVAIGQPALDHAETLNVAPDDRRLNYIVSELRYSVGRPRDP